MDETLFPLDEEPTRESPATEAPLADRMRPETLEDVVGQRHLLGEGRFLRSVVEADEVPSMIFWGPPGVGKTTLARLIARRTRAHFVSLSAVLDGVREVRKVVEEARLLQRRGRRTLLFVDEIHRFNRAQQDAFLPHVEAGRVVLIGATTENPSFEVIAPLLSRCRVVVLEPLEEEAVVSLLQRALRDRQRGLGSLKLKVDRKTLEQIALFSNGDARVALNALEAAARLAGRSSAESAEITRELLEEAFQKRTLLYDKAGEEHYNLISALHKSLRNSDPDAALYWLARMLEAGEDPLYVARRLVRFASEDVGLADPRALGYALDAMRAVDFIGLPEGKPALAQAAVYLAYAAKSNALYKAYLTVEQDLRHSRNEPVPPALRNAPTRLMKDLGYSRGYRYAHDEVEGVADLQCLPDSLAERNYYLPTERGFEKLLRERGEEIRRLKKQARLRNPGKKPG